MKNYPTKAYYNYARKLLEGDASATLDRDIENVSRPQFKKLVLGASAGAVGALACLKYLDRYFSVASLDTAATKLKDISKGVADRLNPSKATAMVNQGRTIPGTFEKIGGSIAGAVERAIRWVMRLIGSITKHFEFLRKPIFGDASKPVNLNYQGSMGPTYGSVLSMALVAAAVGAVMYKIYKVIVNRRASTETVESFNLKQSRRLKKALNESNMMFEELGMLTEGPVDWTKYNKGDKVAQRLADLESQSTPFLKRVQAFLWRMYANIHAFYTTHKAFCIIVCLCTALVACWFGVKKYMTEREEVGEPDFAAESVRPTAKKRTRRMVRKSAYSF